jgi:hypothetical protein
MWNDQCHAGDARDWGPIKQVVIVLFQVYHSLMSSSSPRTLFSKTLEFTTRATEIPYPKLCNPSSPPSKTVRLHSHSDHPIPHQQSSWGWSVDRVQESWDGMREVLVFI